MTGYYEIDFLGNDAANVFVTSNSHTLRQRLYWVDIPKGRLFRYHPASGTHEQCFEGEPLGSFTIQADGALLTYNASADLAGAVALANNPIGQGITKNTLNSFFEKLDKELV